MANQELNQAAEDLNRSAVHVQDELNRRIDRLKTLKGDKDSSAALASMKKITTQFDKLFDELQDFVPTEKETAAAESEDKPARKKEE